MPNNNKKRPLKISQYSKWEDKNYIIEAGAVNTTRTEGIALRTAKKYPDRSPIIRKSLFIHKNQNIQEILQWIYITVKEFFHSLRKKEFITEDEIEKSNILTEELRNKLKDKERENELLRNDYSNQQKELKLAYDVIENSQKYSNILSNFELKIMDSVSNNKFIEEWIKNELKKNRWILGIDCEVKAKNKDIDTETEIDLHIVTNYGEERVIEIKSPNIKIFSTQSGGRLNIRPEVAVSLSEVIEYMRRTDAYSSFTRGLGVYSIHKPIGRVIIGYETTTQEENVLKDWNFYLGPYIKIITFKELINSAKKEIELIELAKKTQSINKKF